jgi:hypothetical protein
VFSFTARDCHFRDFFTVIARSIRLPIHFSYIYSIFLRRLPCNRLRHTHVRGVTTPEAGHELKINARASVFSNCCLIPRRPTTLLLGATRSTAASTRVTILMPQNIHYISNTPYSQFPIYTNMASEKVASGKLKVASVKFKLASGNSCAVVSRCCFMRTRCPKNDARRK